MGDIEVAIPSKKWDLKEHNAQCEKELARLHARLKIVMGDIEVMTTILKMTDCDANKNGAFMQNAANLDVMKCSDACTKKSFIAFNDKVLQDKVSKIKSKFGKDLVQDTFGALFDGIKDLQTVEATFFADWQAAGWPCHQCDKLHRASQAASGSSRQSLRWGTYSKSSDEARSEVRSQWSCLLQAAGALLAHPVRHDGRAGSVVGEHQRAGGILRGDPNHSGATDQGCCCDAGGSADQACQSNRRHQSSHGESKDNSIRE